VPLKSPERHSFSRFVETSFSPNLSFQERGLHIFAQWKKTYTLSRLSLSSADELFPERFPPRALVSAGLRGFGLVHRL